MYILNIVTRSLVIIVGAGIAVGIAPFDTAQSPFHEIFGVVVILFGTYRLVSYIIRYKQLQ